MFARILKSAAIAVAALGLAAGANAATIFNFSFMAPLPLTTPATGSGQIFTNDLGNGTYQVYDVVGTAKLTSTSSAATLNTVSAAAFSSLSITGNATSGFTFTGMLSGPTTSYNFARNIFDSNYTISNGLRSSSASTFSLTQVPISAPVPEIGTWMMMVLGFGVIGATLRAGRRSPTIQHLR
ncbi:hypothetical protein Q4F19_12165 [Sphingomonas sp. BIUV-7]|uniref:PEP-CTERM protein-sorting domain-containing protein n=1 Tax=Sphingomonas natans TaxID=3063330 RepID=A0ABT8YAW9_9SPHN|nr:hypothetical protein [Sphingomonas sp. BIUV-7]MDO6415137.1 hypothetical protein [Sphingomonas sp. BIUV-7]